MRKIIFILLCTILLASCFTCDNEGWYTYRWKIINKTQQKYRIVLSTPEIVIDEYLYSNGDIEYQRMIYFGQTDGFRELWQELIANGFVKCDIWNENLHKQWTLNELETGKVDDNQKHIFRESDWTLQGNPSYDCTWTFEITTDDLK